MNFLKRKRQGKEGTTPFQIDMSKTYDQIEWSFLKSIMFRMGSFVDFVDLIMLCVSIVTYKIKKEGVDVSPIVPSRGLRHGDPLSLYIFTICAEGLSSLIHHYDKAGLLHRVRVARGAPCITHLFLVDDCFLFFKTSVQEAHLMKSILSMYGVVSGQKVNYNKSSISFSMNVRDVVVHQICELLGVTATVDHGTYLGLPSSIGRRKLDALRYIKDKVWKRLQGWNQKLLSREGKRFCSRQLHKQCPIMS